MKKILFVQPSTGATLISLPPLGLLTLASITDKRKYFIKIIDEDKESINFNEHWDLVCISVFLASKQRAYKISEIFRKKKVKVIMGGAHATPCPGDVVNKCDTVVVGLAEFIWEQILTDFENENLNQKYISKKIAFRKIKLDWSLIKHNYLINNLVLTTRGCPYYCKFCQLPNLFGRKIVHKPIEDVIDEIRDFRKDGLLKKGVYICDDNLIADRSYTLNLFKKLAPLNIRIGALCSINIARDDELLEWAYKAGVRFLQIGFETTNKGSLAAMQKPNNPNEYCYLVNKLQETGIYVLNGFFIVGFNEQSVADIREIIKFAEDYTFFATFANLQYMPGTQLTSEMGFTDSHDSIFVKKTKNLGNIKQTITKCNKEYYSLYQILRRVIRTIGIKKPFYSLFYFVFSLYVYFKVKLGKI